MFGVLIVQDVQYEDRGRYTCTARNILGSDTAFATLTVHGEYKLSITVSMGFSILACDSQSSTLLQPSLPCSFFFAAIEKIAGFSTAAGEKTPWKAWV